MFDFLTKKPKVQKILLSSQENVDIVIYLFESLKTKHSDAETLAYIKTPAYHSFGKISQKQFDLFNEDFKFQKGEFSGEAPSMEKLIEHSLPIHKSYAEAKTENYRLNLAFIYTFYWPSQRESELAENDSNRFFNFTLRDEFLRYEEEYSKASDTEKAEFHSRSNFAGRVISNKFVQYEHVSIKLILEALKKYPVLELAYNDYNEAIFDRHASFSHRSPNHYLFVKANFDESLGQCRTIAELASSILAKNNQVVADSFRKEMQTYLAENIQQTATKKRSLGDIYVLNQNLLNRLVFLGEYLNFANYSWHEIVVLLDRFDEKEHYFNESLFFPCTTLKGEPDDKYYLAFRQHLDFLKNQGFDLYKVFKYWNLYTSTMKTSAELLPEVDFDFNPQRYKDLNRTYNYLGKRLAERLENFEFKNFNGEKFNNNIPQLNTIKIGAYSLEVISDFKELFAAGAVLENCAGTKNTLKEYKEKITFILKENDTIKFMGCLQDGKFKQLKGYKNSSPSFELFKELYLTLVDLNFIVKIEEHDTNDRYSEQYIGDLWRAAYEQECVHH